MDAKAICKALIESGAWLLPVTRLLLTPLATYWTGLTHPQGGGQCRSKGSLCGQNCLVMGQWEQRLASKALGPQVSSPRGTAGWSWTFHSALGASI